MTKEITCKICGGELASSRHSTRDIHQSLGTCIKILRTRAEAAEDDLRELRENTLLALGVNPADVADDMADGSIRYILGGLLDRLAELPADGRWRPVTGVPTASGTRSYVVWRGRAPCCPTPRRYGAKENDEMIDELYTRTESSIRYWTREELLIRAERAETRLAELEAAARWRPVSERPPNDAPVLALMESGEYKVVRYVDKVGGVTLRYWRGTGGTSKHVAYWRPIASRPGMI